MNGRHVVLFTNVTCTEACVLYCNPLIFLYFTCLCAAARPCVCNKQSVRSLWTRL